MHRYQIKSENKVVTVAQRWEISQILKKTLFISQNDIKHAGCLTLPESGGSGVEPPGDYHGVELSTFVC